MMKKFFKTIFALCGTCLALGVIVSKLEKKKSWVEGHTPHGLYEAQWKRPFDFGLSLFALILLCPLMLIIALAVRVKMGTPVLYEQERPGLGGKVFKLKKFRSMTNEKDAAGNDLSDEKRLTDFGKALRSTSVDELPELFNILAGDMSLVGPRPLLTAYLDRYTEEQKHRHDVRPGLTGLAQVNGRNAISWEEKFRDDVTYVKNITFFGDLKILLQTIAVVFRRDGISSENSVTMEAFTGNQG